MAESMYKGIAHDLRQQIESGVLPPGEQLPTEDELSDKYHASRNTIRDAIKWLKTRNLVETRPGRGTFVARRPAPFVTTLSSNTETGLGGGEGKDAFSEVEERGRTAFAKPPEVKVQTATGNVRARLRVPDGTMVVSRQQERFIDDTPWSLQTTYYPMDLVMRGAAELLSDKDIKDGAVAYLKETLGLVQVGYRDRILVRPPHEDEARFFGLPDDGRVNVMSLMRTGYQAGDDGPFPFRVTITVLPADRNQLVINSGDVPSALAEPVEP